MAGRSRRGRPQSPLTSPCASGWRYFSRPWTSDEIAQATAVGATFRREPHPAARMPDHELRMAFFHDTEGNVLALMEEVRGKK